MLLSGDLSEIVFEEKKNVSMCDGSSQWFGPRNMSIGFHTAMGSWSLSDWQMSNQTKTQQRSRPPFEIRVPCFFLKKWLSWREVVHKILLTYFLTGLVPLFQFLFSFHPASKPTTGREVIKRMWRHGDRRWRFKTWLLEVKIKANKLFCKQYRFNDCLTRF